MNGCQNKYIPNSKRKKVSFFDNIFYWLWFCTTSKGFPERSFAVVTIFQFAYLIFVVSLVLITLSDRTLLLLYEKPEPVLFSFISNINSTACG
jgi:hypothetical protein